MHQAPISDASTEYYDEYDEKKKEYDEKMNLIKIKIVIFGIIDWCRQPSPMEAEDGPSTNGHTISCDLL